MALKPLDFLIIIFSLGVITLYIYNTIDVSNNSSFVKVEVEGKEYLYPLDKNDEHIFHGPLGDTTVRIKDKKAAIIDSSCPNKTCVEIGEIEHGGQSSACLPNRVLVTITGDNGGEIDVISY